MRGKLVYWPLNRLNEEESGRGQGAGKEEHVEEQEGKGNPASKLNFLKREDEGNSISNCLLLFFGTVIVAFSLNLVRIFYICP